MADPENVMEQRIAYCSVCDRPVRVLVRKDAPPWPDPAGARLDDVVCLEHGETCTGSMCPIFDIPTEQMRENLAAHERASSEGETPT